MMYRFKVVTAKKMAIRITRNVQPVSATAACPKRSVSVNFTFSALMITSIRKKKDPRNIHNMLALRKVV